MSVNKIFFALSSKCEYMTKNVFSKPDGTGMITFSTKLLPLHVSYSFLTANFPFFGFNVNHKTIEIRTKVFIVSLSAIP